MGSDERHSKTLTPSPARANRPRKVRREMERQSVKQADKTAGQGLMLEEQQHHVSASRLAAAFIPLAVATAITILIYSRRDLHPIAGVSLLILQAVSAIFGIIGLLRKT